MPLIIYLDTQDYINIFNEDEGGPYARTLKRLMEFKRNGDIRVGYSFSTVLEFITKPDARNRDERVRRGDLIKKICGANAFPFITDHLKGARFPNEGMWLGSPQQKLVTASSFRKTIKTTLREELAKIEGLSRKQRRYLQNEGNASALVRNILNKSGMTWGRRREDWGNIPVTDEIIKSRIFERFILGECSDKEFEERINGWVMDPSEFS